MTHNDYTREAPLKYEIFTYRIEIISVGSLPEGLSRKEFFDDYSIPRNKELMRVYKDVEMVEQLGTGVMRITAYYGHECFHFSENFTRMVFPSAEKVIAEPVSKHPANELPASQRKILEFVKADPTITKKEMAAQVGIGSTAIDKNIKTLKEMNLLERVGSDRKGYWKIIS